MTARVRIPLGVLDINRTPGPVVKLEFTPACQAGGRGFESRRDRSGLPLGSLAAYMVRIPFHVALGRVAQLAERPPEKRKVTGSTPVSTTTGACRRLLSFLASHLDGVMADQRSVSNRLLSTFSTEIVVVD